MQSSIEEISLESQETEQNIFRIKQEINKEILPGQIDSLEEDTADMSSSSDDFDVEIFRNQEQQQQQKENKLKRTDKKLIKIFGFEFDIEILQERNKNPVLLLQCIFFSLLLGDFSFFILFAVGLNFSIVPLLLVTSVIVVVFFLFSNLCKQSIKNGLKLDPKNLIFVAFGAIAYSVLFVYSIFVQTPFNSLPFFLLGIYLSNIVFSICTTYTVAPNFTPFDDPNYQLRFFGPRIMAGFFNGTGAFDAISDVVLGIQLLQYPSKKLITIGVFLLILCNVDYIFVVMRALIPSKIGIRLQIFTLLNELIIMALTAVVLLDVSNISQNQQSEDALTVVVISISTTVVNFLHNAVLLFYTVLNSEMKFVDRGSGIM
eukprot:TRINITY_DN9702_c0_g1_i2.p1 TRINITY_DN9702_c0_g1~~TRINITY_DN9702_c0_g1_i2.p1  ORF type:complete len:373 (-),score=25.61 TRINITY_DN9702_c0_g1_i2:166-1284(-)